MPQIKNKQPFYGWHRLVLVELENHFRKQRKELPTDAFWLVFFACYPEKLNHHWYESKEREQFTDAFSANADATLGILTFARKTMNKWRGKNTNRRSVALDFFLSHNCLVKKGNRFALISDRSLTDKDRNKPNARRMVLDLYDGEIAEFLTQQAGVEISPDDVKKARQLLAKKVKL